MHDSGQLASWLHRLFTHSQATGVHQTMGLEPPLSAYTL